jgi:quercetin dioxygenase-like cupin family protein
MKTIIYEDQIEVQKLPGRDLKWLITPETEVTENFSMNVVTIKPGNTVRPAHAHPDLEEVIYITGGEGQVLIDGDVHELRTGTAVLFKAGSIHMVRNTGNQDMKIVCFFSPPATLKNYTFYEAVDFPAGQD